MISELPQVEADPPSGERWEISATGEALDASYRLISRVLVERGLESQRFSRSAVMRRALRRMRDLEIEDIEHYAARVVADAEEARLLARGLLQPVGTIFREAETCAALLRLLPQLAQASPRLQVWVPACGRGEEAFAFALLIADALNAQELPLEFTVFGSDEDREALRQARRGVIAPALAERVPAHLRQAWLREGPAGYPLDPQLLRQLVFLHQPAAASGPLFDLDAVICRNLLDHLDLATQRRTVEQLHASLRPGGVLLTGRHDQMGPHADLFARLDSVPHALRRIESDAPTIRRGAADRSGAAGDTTLFQQSFARARRSALIVQPDARVVAANSAAVTEFPEALGNNRLRSFTSLLAPAHRDRVNDVLHSLAATGPVALDVELERGGSLRLVLSPIEDGPGGRIHVEMTGADAPLHDDLARAGEKLAGLLRALGEGVIALDGQGRVTEFNLAAERLTGWMRAEVLGQPYLRVFRLQASSAQAAQDDPVEAALQGRVAGGDRTDLYLQHRDGRRFALRLRLRPASGAGVLLVFEDISEVSLLTEELAYRATHDPLTGLLNREEFESRARAAVAEAQRGERTSVMCFVDVDQFKIINDTLGHAAGDELLHELAGELRGSLTEHDAFARLGGDEFGVLLAGRDLDSARGVVDELMDRARRFRFAWAGQTHAITVSVGAALIDASTEDVARPMSLADAASFVAKDAGRDRARFAGDDDELAGRHVEMSLVGKIGKALDQGRFLLHYEDVVAIDDPKRVTYRELLVRMRDEDGRVLMPGSFIQAAERYFMMGALDRWVLRAALRGIARVPEDGVTYALNLSGQSIGDERFLDFVLNELDASGVDPERICFEITETAAVSRLTEAVRFVARISAAGCRFALDDFGAGMASFSYLKNFSVNYLKIDGSFVRAMLGSRADRGMVESINRIGHEMGLKTIAEHVESPELLGPLREMGVDWAQGRAIAWGRPFEELIKSESAAR